MDQAEYDGLTPQEQIDIFDRVSRKTAIDMIAQIDALKEEVAKLREDKQATIGRAWVASGLRSLWSMGKGVTPENETQTLVDYIKQELGDAAVGNEGGE